MSQEKLTTAHYQNVGGINEKASKYVTGMMEFLNLVNFDLNTPGAISKRPGSTQYMVAGVTGTVTGIHEFFKINGLSQVIFSANHGIYLVNDGRTATGLYVSNAGWADNSHVSMRTFADFLWIANGQTYLKFDGQLMYPVGFGATAPLFNAVSWSGIGFSTGALKGSRYLLGYVNGRGEYSHTDRDYMSLRDGQASGGFSAVYMGLTLMPSAATFGVSYFAIYRNDDFNSSGISYFPGGTAGVNYDKTGTFYLLAKEPIGSTFYLDTAGYTSLVTSPVIAKDSFYFHSYLDNTGTTVIARVPQYLEIHQNSMFMAGFSYTPSTMWYSDVGDPESIDPDFNFEVRTNDGDVIRGIKSFGNQLIVFKENSFHRVVGDNPSNYELDEISSDYGAISNKAIATAEGVCYFLDQKGIVKYNGASWELISDRMESTFRRMNLNTSRLNAVAVHYSFRHQIWFSFALDSSTVNNIIVVYDYRAKTMFKYEGLNAASLVQINGGFNNKTVFMGTYSGMIHNFSPSLYADNGNAFTLIAQPRFDQPQGPNHTAHFRRLWMDVEPVSGITGTVSVNILKDMSQTGITTMNVYQTQFQSRLEFGVQAKAIGFIFAHRHQSLPCQINGWAIGHRVLREL